VRKKCFPVMAKWTEVMCFNIIPKVLVFSVTDNSVRVSKKISFCDGDSLVVFSLKGIRYIFGDFHYTAVYVLMVLCGFMMV